MSEINETKLRKKIEILDDFINNIDGINSTKNKIIEFAEKNLKYFIGTNNADNYIKYLNFNISEPLKAGIYNYIFCLFYDLYNYTEVSPELITTSLYLFQALIREGNNKLKVEKQISETYKYAFDKIEGIKWHPYPKEKPSMDDVYIVSLVINSEKPYSWISYYRKEDGFSEDYNGSVVNAWAEMPEPYKEEL